ncbi:uncharacterized protein RCC_01819 [Ramularia collo-cygni]|uniref:Uncharacterized protein n=1 Tax=Ramularia collo-cygni TaxID=112498 RepID=A0A2D3V398_9PEZI|nr:uncharacterized protein RCC_01819 [Ramularia collo-cygni]CZT15979.1 uncharacterized protein RCC_01819 [Ramularia collo-cygni]
MSPASLHLFPASTTTGPSRLPSLRKTQKNATNKVAPPSRELKLNGVAFQVVSAPRVAPSVEPIQHSLFCAPEPALPSPATVDLTGVSAQANKGPVRRHSRTRRRSSQIASSPETNNSNAAPGETDELTALPINTQFGSSSPPRRILSSHLRRPNPIQTAAPIASPNNGLATPTDENDSLSPLPTKTRFTPPSPSLPAYSPPMRSMFPTYDPQRPLDGQRYYPTSRAQSPAVFTGDHSAHIASPVEKAPLKRYDSGVGLINGYEHIPAAAHADLEAVWKASEEEYPCDGRKVQFGLYQPEGHGTALSIGTSHADIVYSLEKDITIDAPVDVPQPREFAVKKHSPTSPCSSPVAQLILPAKSATAERHNTSTAIFPRKAAIAAIESISNSPQAVAIATFDPTADSPEAARMAQNAVAMAYRNYSCDLINKTRRQDSLGGVVAQYDLRHPVLGTCAVTVTKSQSATSSTGPRAKIAFHHPSATPAAIEADTLNLAFLDFAHNACVLDIPGLIALDSHYVIDTVVCALLAVAVIENDALVAGAVVFEAPPRTPLPRAKKQAIHTTEASSSDISKKWFKRSDSKKETQMVVVEDEKEEQVKLPIIARGAIKVVGLTFRVGFWGVKVTAKAVVGAGKVLLK